MQILYTILYIILFILCLSILIVVHELGHLGAAKFFKVYCEEFSIGFGPALIHKKRKNGETYFSLRAIPFGGYVSMYEDGVELPSGTQVDPSRSLSNIRKWKKIIILFAGVFNNAVLALILFFISETACIQKGLYLNYLSVTPNSIAETAGISTDDYISLRQYVYSDGEKEVTTSYYVVDRDARVIVNGVEEKAIALLNTQIASFSQISYNDHLKYFPLRDDLSANLAKEYVPTDTSISGVKFSITTAKSAYKQYVGGEWILIPHSKPNNPTKGEAYINDTERKMYVWDGSNWVNHPGYTTSYTIPTSPKSYDIWLDLEATKTVHPISIGTTTSSDNKRVYQQIGVSYLYEEYWNDFGTAIKKTFIDWGNSATIIARSFISLFTTPETWKDVGGIVAIGVQTSNILQNMGIGKFIYIWGLISVNLAIINLLPFPGLDGWQILVTVIEGLFHKEIPNKVKNIISFVGIALLMGFMVLILIKDVIGLF